MDHVVKFRVKKSERVNAKHVDGTRVFTDNEVNNAIIYDLIEVLNIARKLNKIGVNVGYQFNGEYYFTYYFLQDTNNYTKDFILSLYYDIKSRYQQILDKQLECRITKEQIDYIFDIMYKESMLWILN